MRLAKSQYWRKGASENLQDTKIPHSPIRPSLPPQIQPNEAHAATFSGRINRLKTLQIRTKKEKRKIANAAHENLIISLRDPTKTPPTLLQAKNDKNNAFLKKKAKKANLESSGTWSSLSSTELENPRNPLEWLTDFRIRVRVREEEKASKRGRQLRGGGGGDETRMAWAHEIISF